MSNSPEKPSEESSDPKPEAPRRKGGRPKGSPNRPKWLLEELKKLPKRPRGRPKGSKGKPKTVEELIEYSLKPIEPIKRPLRTPGPVIKSPTAKEPYMTRLKREDPEKLREMSRKAALSRKTFRGQPAGAPRHMTQREWAARLEDARILAKKVYKYMDTEGSLPENPVARLAMKKALTLLAEEGAAKDKIALIRTLLEYNMAKPAATQNINVKTAEDFLDELANEGD